MVTIHIMAESYRFNLKSELVVDTAAFALNVRILVVSV